MGLDVVELVMNVEEAFGVRFEDRELERTRTVGDLYVLVLTRLGRRPGADFCPSSRVFYRLRQALDDVFGVERRRVTTAARVEDLLPAAARRAGWYDLSTALGGWRLPRLDRPPGVTAACAGLSLGAGAGVVSLCVGPQGAVLAPALAACAAAGLVMALAVVATTPAATCLPAGCVTVRDLATEVLRLNEGAVLAEAAAERDDAAWGRLVEIVAEFFAVDPAEIDEATDFILDLGAG